MKKFTFLSVFIMSIFYSTGQINPIQSTVAKYDFTAVPSGLSSIAIPVNFNENNLLEKIPDSLTHLTVERIDLVYTTYALNPTFDQTALNKSRIQKISSAWPRAKNEAIRWNEVGQTAANSPERAKELFHGFVIYYRPTPTAESIKEELDFIDAILAGKPIPKKPGPAIHSLSDSKISSKPEKVVDHPVPAKAYLNELPMGLHLEVGKCYEVVNFDHWGDTSAIIQFTEKLSKTPKYGGHTITVAGTANKSKYHYFGAWFKESEECDYDAAERRSSIINDWFSSGDYSIVKTVFERNPTWENTHIVMDVTGSMSPYIAQTMAWIKDKQVKEQVAAFTFFNDGNMTPDFAKITGKVGGIYSVKNDGFNTVYSEMKSTMQKGGGGDAPENNIEAIIEGMRNYPNCNEIIMVADNFATPRDLELVRKLNVPVHVILCGTNNRFINTEYVQLAYDTKGSVHTMENDLDFNGIEPNKTLKIGQHYFTILNGRIIHAENKA